MAKGAYPSRTSKLMPVMSSKKTPANNAPAAIRKRQKHRTPHSIAILTTAAGRPAVVTIIQATTG
jgi:hypothetical protein